MVRMLWVVIDDEGREVERFSDPRKACDFARRYGYSVILVKPK